MMPKVNFMEELEIEDEVSEQIDFVNKHWRENEAKFT